MNNTEIVPVVTGDIDHKYEYLVALDNGQGLTPEAVLADAQNPESPLHSLFEWDDSAAAFKYRKLQATAVIHRFKVLRTGPEGDVSKVRAWVFLPSEKKHRHIDDVVKDAGLADEVLGQMKRDLLAFTGRYQTFHRLLPAVGTTIDEVAKIANGL